MDELLKDFLTESSEQLEAIDAQLARFEREPSDSRIVANIFRLVHVIKSACGFLNLRRLEKVAHSAETLVMRVRNGAAPNADDVALMLAMVDRIRLILTAVAEGRGEPPGDDDQLIAEIESAGEPARNAPGFPVPRPGSVLEDVLGAGTPPTERRADSVRLSLDALERLTSLVSELALTRNQLVADAASADALRAPLRRLSMVTADLRSGLQAARMLPIARLFASLHRLVRGLSAEMGKKVELTLRGGETQIDRQLIEAVRDPLTQIIRNAVAHGVESPEVRRGLGKPEVGVIELSVRCEAGILSIDVADDGSGLDFHAIRERFVASERGSREELAMSRTDLCRFVLTSGFCAVERLGGVSRRNSGLALVHANLEPIGGTASLTNRPGHGATVNLQIPLSTVIVRALMLRAGDERYALPQRFVEEIVELDPNDDGALIEVRGALSLVTAEGIVPAGHLRTLMGSPTGSQDRGRNPRVALKIRVGPEGFALIADEMIDVQDIVLEPLPAPLRNIPSFSAAVVLGDGSVVLVLEPYGLASALGLPKSLASRTRPASEIKARPSLTNFVVFRSNGPTLRALPVSAVVRILRLRPEQIELAEDGCVILVDDRRIPLVDIEGRRSADLRVRETTALLLRNGDGGVALIVDEVVDVATDEPGVGFAGADRATLGVAILGGGPVEILDPTLFFDHREILRPFGSARAEGAAVLILEPAAFFQTMIAGALGRSGYQVRAVGDLAAALAALGAEQPCSAALVDVDLAVAHQDEIARDFRDAVLGRAPVLIGLASHGGPKVRAKAQTAGLLTAVGKFDRTAMLTALGDALRKTEIAA